MPHLLKSAPALWANEDGWSPLCVISPTLAVASGPEQLGQKVLSPTGAWGREANPLRSFLYLCQMCAIGVLRSWDDSVVHNSMWNIWTVWSVQVAPDWRHRWTCLLVCQKDKEALMGLPDQHHPLSLDLFSCLLDCQLHLPSTMEVE